MQGKLIIFSSPSGAGKTTIVRHILEKHPELAFSVSACTRAIRQGEIEGKDYYFLNVSDFKKKIDSGDFLEWEEVYKDRFYGTLKSEIERLWKLGKHVVFDIDVKGAVNIKKYYRDKAFSIFIKPPNMEVLEQRLRNRKTENEESLKERLERAVFESSYEDKFDKVILNDNLQLAIAEADQAVKTFLKK